MENEKTQPLPFKLKIFTDKNLQSYLAQGWDYDALISGKIRTLHGRTFEIECDETMTILELKFKIEDQEGYERKDQIIMKRKTKLDDSKTLGEYFITDTSKTTLLLQMPLSFDTLNKDSDTKGGLKQKQRGAGTKTMTVTDDQEKKMYQGDYYQSPDNYLSSGPQTPSPKTTNQSPFVDTVPTTVQSFSGQGKILTDSKIKEVEISESEKRNLMLQAAQKRNKK